MRLMFICDNCKQWNELDALRDKKNRSEYTVWEVKDMGLEIEVEINSEINCTNEKADIQIDEISDYSDYFESECETASIKFKCSHCGDSLRISFE
ncbi:MAG: hypothetical protein WC123_06840 [Bacilli bacterium]|jgi:hypothetical protein